MRRAAVAAATVTVIAAAGVSHGTFAAFTGATRNGDSTFALTSLYAPGSLTALPAGNAVELSWTAGGNGNGYTVLSASAPNPLVNDCTGALYSAVTTVTGSTTSFVDTALTPTGTWRCYTVRTSYHSWTSVQDNPVAGARMGFVASVASFSNTGNPRIDDNDTITITFNQAVDASTGPQTGSSICWVNDRIVLGSTQSGNCSATEVPRLGWLTGGTIERNMRLAASWSWSGDGRTLTITVGSRLSGSGNYAHSGSWTFTPTTNVALLKSANGGLHVCDNNSGGGNCTPAVNGL